ncbi:MAG: sigma-54-dependent Fis family transcriptional regulator [Calditrichaeota bacterium]|nr:sigma-54-dependent Fis family transcriptional regulator [Calditrichota bacterium]
MKKVLIVDDEIEMLNSFQKLFKHRKDFDLTLVPDGREALNLIKDNFFDLMLLDLKMERLSGMEVLEKALTIDPGIKVIMISGYGTIEASVEAMRKGAFDFIEKPFTARQLFDRIDKVLRTFSSSSSVPSRGEEENFVNHFENIIYRSPQMERIIQMVRKIAPSNMCVLISGGSGTGKELIARAIHRWSPRNSGPFVPVNCGAVPEHLFESELFGHEKGSFTGAEQTKPGLLEFADKGTFFLDEISELSLPLQVKLLRMLEEQKFRHVGGQKEIHVDVRIISATNKNLREMVEKERFREDLFFRLNAFEIEVPPLYTRPEDIIPLANYFLKDLCQKNSNKVVELSEEAKEILISYSWPGNVRELKNMITRAYMLCSSQIIQAEDIPLPQINRKNFVSSNIFDLSYKHAKDKILQEFEIEYLKYHLKKNQGNISMTAKSCGLDRRTIHRLINKLGIVYQDKDND